MLNNMQTKIMESSTYVLNKLATIYHYAEEMPEDLKNIYKASVGHIVPSIDFYNLTKEDFNDLRFSKWDDEPNVYLIPLYLAEHMPKGIEVFCINGTSKKWDGTEDLDIRFGCIAFGLKPKEVQDVK